MARKKKRKSRVNQAGNDVARYAEVSEALPGLLLSNKSS